MTIALTGCAGQPLKTKIVDKYKKTWRINSANTHYKDGVINISGYMQPSRRFATRTGHIDIIIVDSAGKILLKKTAVLGKRVMRKGGGYFSLKHKGSFPDDVIITVEYKKPIGYHYLP